MPSQRKQEKIHLLPRQSDSSCAGEKMLKCVNTDKAFELVKDMPWFPELKKRICDRALWFLNFRLKDEVKIEVVMFTTDRNNLIKSEGADELIEKIRKDQDME